MNKEVLGLGSSLRAVLTALDHGVEEIYARAGETFRPRFFPVVQLLMSRPSMRVSDLAAQCGVSQPAMSQTIGAMHTAGIVADQRSGDRRERQVSLTPDGRAQAERLERIWTATERAAHRLERESGPLMMTLARVLREIEHEPFAARIERELR